MRICDAALRKGLRRFCRFTGRAFSALWRAFCGLYLAAAGTFPTSWVWAALRAFAGLLGGRVLWRPAGLFGAALLLRKPQYQRLEQHFICTDISYRVERFLLTLYLNDNKMEFVLLRIFRLVSDKKPDPYSENKSSATFCHNKTKTRRVSCYDYQRPN